ncbi:MAG: FAD-linked oxidase C-terminal domain-containing protein [bacterium]
MRRLVGAGKVKTEAEDLLAYSSDASRYYVQGKPEAVVLSECVGDVVQVVRYANAHGVPLTPRGAGSGLSGGATPIHGGIVLDTKRMHRILEINQGNMTARVECGLVLAAFQRAVEKLKLFYPPDPQSMEVCTLGGNVATGAGGPHGVKYGTTQDYVLGLEAVLPDGSVIQTGGLCVKRSTGYNLTKLLTGSEGTLAVITKANLRLLPLPPARKTLIVVCDSVELASELVSRLIYERAVPAVLEYIAGAAMALMNSYHPMPVALDGQAYLLVELDGSESAIREENEKVFRISAEMKVREVKTVEDEKQAAQVWQARRNIAPLLYRMFKKVVHEDVAVPRDKIPAMVKAVNEISASLGIMTGMGGHAGDGNIHPGVLYLEVNEEMDRKAEEAVRRIILKGIELGGTISGEHGLGLHKSQFLELECGREQIELMKRVKQAFDPKGIMNPGKIWVDAEARA